MKYSLLFSSLSLGLRILIFHGKNHHMPAASTADSNQNQNWISSWSLMPKQYFILIVTASSSRACAFLSFGLITHLAFYHISQGAISERSDRPALRPKGCNKWLHTLTSPTPCFNEYCLPFSTSRLECLADNIMNCSTDVPSMNIGRDLIDLSKGTDVLRTGLVRIRGLGRISKRLWKMRQLTLVENALLIQHVSRISTPLGFVF